MRGGSNGDERIGDAGRFPRFGSDDGAGEGEGEGRYREGIREGAWFAGKLLWVGGRCVVRCGSRRPEPSFLPVLSSDSILACARLWAR